VGEMSRSDGGGCPHPGSVEPMTQPNPNTKMPKWLLYGLIAKGALIAVVIIGVTIFMTMR